MQAAYWELRQAPPSAMAKMETLKPSPQCSFQPSPPVHACSLSVRVKLAQPNNDVGHLVQLPTMVVTIQYQDITYISVQLTVLLLNIFQQELPQG